MESCESSGRLLAHGSKVGRSESSIRFVKLILKLAHECQQIASSFFTEASYQSAFVPDRSTLNTPTGPHHHGFADFIRADWP